MIILKGDEYLEYMIAKEYLEFKFTNDYKDIVTIRVDDAVYEEDEEVSRVANQLVELEVFQGKNAIVDRALNARLVTVNYDDIAI